MFRTVGGWDRCRVIYASLAKGSNLVALSHSETVPQAAQLSLSWEQQHGQRRNGGAVTASEIRETGHGGVCVRPAGEAPVCLVM